MFLLTNAWVEHAVKQRGLQFGPISYMPILPPLWAALPTDTAHYKRPRPLTTIPSLLTLDGQSSCSCKSIQAVYNPARTTIESTCTIYTLTRGVPSHVQLQQCQACSGRRHQYIGPETRDLGVFNFNNRVLFTHDLLDDYTSAYTCSETPFTAWVKVLAQRYTTQDSQVPFVSEEVFRAAWFGYVNLQDFSNDMRCRKCGPTPEDTVWDGVTLAFHEKHLLPSLRPPTTLHENSAIRKAKYVPTQQVLKDKKLRKMIKNIILGPSLCKAATQNDSDDEDATEGVGGHGRTLTDDTLIERLTSIPLAYELLNTIDSSLAKLFRDHFGLVAISSGIKPPPPYKRLFLQVS